ncbi:MAG: sugar phosphate isomerase/epimerase family protein [Pirellulaceae bacterium]
MTHNRRSFLHTTLATTSTALAANLVANKAQCGEFTGKIRKAVKYHMIADKIPVSDKLRLLKDLGFDGVETNAVTRGRDCTIRELANASEKTGVPVHGVVNSSRPDIQAAIDEAVAYGATSVLHVVRYDRNISYRQNYQQTQQLIRQAIPHAEKKNVKILIENVWASFLIEPLGMARYVDELDSPFVQVYFDIGNVVRWGWPEHWIEVLGSRAQKLDVKEYDLKIAMNEGMRKGFRVPIGEGSIEWAKVRAELKKINYQGWATAEVAAGDRQRLTDIAAQMDRVLDL